jgi:hypothetical protein
MTRDELRAGAVVLLVLAFTTLAGEAVHELHYAGVHPDAYGAAKVIALACAGGAVVAFAAGLTALTLIPRTAVRLVVLLLMLLVAVAAGIWLVTLTTGAPGSSGLG